MKIIKKILISSLIVVALVSLTQIKNMPFFKSKKEVLTPPISMPFDLSKGGEKITLSFKVVNEEKFGYDFGFHFKYKKTNRSLLDKIHYKLTVEWFGWFFYIVGLGSHPFFTKPIPEEEAKDILRVQKLVGGDVRENGKIVKYKGLPLLVKIRISEIMNNNDNAIVEKIIEPKTEGTYSKNILDIKLKEGNYKVIIENLKENKKLQETDIIFAIHENRTVYTPKIINYKLIR